MIKAALVLEGGSLRTLYTSGVLDVFIENEIEFECVIGVSAGALNAANYIAKHAGRSAKINILHSNDSNYFGLKQLLFKKRAFNFDYLFYKPIKDLYPFNEEILSTTKQKFLICATDCNTGEAVYFEKNNYSELVNVLQASSSMPLLSNPVTIDGKTCLDGAITDPIGVKKAIAEGYNKIVVVLTRDLDYSKTMAKKSIKILFNIFYKKYPKLINSLNNASINYNFLIEELNKLEQDKKIFVIRPNHEFKISKIEKDARKLINLYFQGRDDVRGLLKEMFEYLNE